MPNHLLRRAREHQGWSQRQLAEMLETNTFTVGRWEAGLAFPSPHFRQKLGELFGLPLEALGLIREKKGSPALAPGTVSTPDHQKLAPLSPATLTLPGTPLGAAFIGRSELLHALKQQVLTGPPTQPVALYGLPGVGKTTLALELAHDADLRAHFADGMLWAALGPSAQPMTVLRQWGRMLGLSTADLADLPTVPALCQALHSLIGERRLLLILDDVWQLDDALACHVGGPNCAALLTTRFPPVAQHFAPHQAMHLGELSESESLLLLKTYASDLDEHDHDRALSLVQAVGGLPLGLKLIGKYLQHQAMSGSARRVHTALTYLGDADVWLHLSESLSPLLVPSHLSHPAPRSLHATIAVSVQMLSPPARQALTALTVFPSKPHAFPERAALAVTETFPATLDELIDAGLLECLPGDRYTVHPTIAEVVRGDASDPGAEQRFIRFYAQFLCAPGRSSEELDEESANIQSALESAARLDMRDELVQSVVAFLPYLLARGEREIAEQQWTRASASAASGSDTLTRARLLLRRGQLATYQGQWQAADEAIQEGIALVQQTTEVLLHCQLLHQLGTIRYKQGKFAETEAVAETGIALARAGGESELGPLLYLCGIVYDKRGNHPQARRCLQESLELAQQAQDAARIGQCLIGLGDFARKRGEWRQEVTSYQEALETYRRIGHRERMCATLVGLGIAHENLGETAQAETSYQNALELARHLGHRERLSSVLLNYGRLLFRCGEHQRAEDCYQESLSLSQALGAGARICTILLNLVALFGARGDLVQARASAQQALEVARQMQYQDHICYALRNLGELAWLQGALPEAEQHLREGHAIATQIASPVASAFCCDGLAIVACLRQDYSEAEHYLREGLTIAEEHDLHERVAVLTLVLARVRLAQGRPEEAAHASQHTEGYARTHRLLWLLGETLNVRGEVALALGNVEAAQAAFTEARTTGDALQSSLYLALATYGLARVAEHGGRREEARHYGRESWERFAQMGHYQAEEVKGWVQHLSGDSTPQADTSGL